jgi:ligand-binding sensor domain-containing protein/AraC-like DNA-binding protein
MKTRLSLLFFLCCLPSVSAQEINFEHIGAANGLSQISVMSIYQDELGYMWFGTGEGLNRYDGKDIEVFRSNENDQNGLTSDVINNICGDLNGQLYILCGYKYLVSYNIQKDKFTLLNKKCQTICQGKKKLWFASENKISQYDYKKKLAEVYYSVKPQYSITGLFEASGGKLYIGTELGLFMLDDNKIFSVIIPNYNITKIYEDSRKNIWIGTAENAVLKINRTGLIDRYSQDMASTSHLSSNIIRDFCEDNFGQIWIATFSGLDKLIPENGEIVNYKNQGDKPTDLSHTSIYSLCKDRQGTIWIGTYYGGINYYNPEANIYTYYYPNPNSPKNINFPFVGKMTEDNAGNLWICTEGGGLNFYDRKNKTFKAFKTEGGNSISHNNLKCIWYNPQNKKLYIGTHMGGLSIYNTKTQRFKVISTHSAQSLPNNVIEAISPYKDKLIILTQKGLVSLDIASENISALITDSRMNKVIGNDITTLLIDSKQNLWMVQTGNGLKCYNLNTHRLKIYPHAFNKPGSIGRHVVTPIFENKSGQLLFATRGSGLYEYLPQKDNFQRYSADNNGLLSDFIYDITETSYGHLVLLTNKEVNLFDTKSNKTISLDKSHGLPLDMINFGCGIYSSRNGEVFVGGTNGMASFFENQVKPTIKDYNLFFSELSVNNQLIRPSDKTNILETAMPYVHNLKLHYDQRKLMHEKYSKQIDSTPIPLTTNKADHELLNRATHIVLNHIADCDFDVSIFASEMAMGRSKLYLELKGLTGMTPNDFILNIRLKTAASMLTSEDDLNISDITYRLGFSTPRYFSKCFKELFGISPFNYRKANNSAYDPKNTNKEV